MKSEEFPFNWHLSHFCPASFVVLVGADYTFIILKVRPHHALHPFTSAEARMRDELEPAFPVSEQLNRNSDVLDFTIKLQHRSMFTVY